MKLLSTTLGRVLVSAAAVIIALTYIASSFMPSIGDFMSKVFPVEKNHEINSSPETFPVSLTDDIFVKSPGETITKWEIFSKLAGDETIINDNTKVFIYKICKDGSTALINEIDSKPEVDEISEINSTVSENWAVFYVANNGGESIVLKAQFVFLS